MKAYILGILTTLIVLAAVSYFCLSMGFLNTRADIRPTSTESKYAMKFLDASVGRRAPTERDPVEPTGADLTTGMHLYELHCAMCHVSPAHPEKNFGHPFYPPAPDFFKRAPDMSEDENFYIVEHGVRWTAMPAWGDTLSDKQIWTVVTFLNQMGKLPPAVEKQWQSLQTTQSERSRHATENKNTRTG